MRNRIVKILVSAVVLFCALFPVSCVGTKDSRNTISDAGAVAKITIHAFDGSYGSLFLLPNFGHSFLSVKNLAGYDITVGSFTLGAAEEVSVGTWVTSAHSGVWYNMEAVYYELGMYNDAATLSKTIDAANLKKLTDYILDNDRWTFFYNCSAFAAGGWNTVSDSDKLTKLLMWSPNYLKTKIEEFSGSLGSIPIKNYSSVGYFVDGEFQKYIYDGEF